MEMVGVASTGGLTAWVVWPGLRVGGRLAPFHIHHMNRVNSQSGLATMTAPYTLSSVSLLLLLLYLSSDSFSAICTSLIS